MIIGSHELYIVNTEKYSEAHFMFCKAEESCDFPQKGATFLGFMM
jgi:hypothetical protein